MGRDLLRDFEQSCGSELLHSSHHAQNEGHASHQHDGAYGGLKAVEAYSDLNEQDETEYGPIFAISLSNMAIAYIELKSHYEYLKCQDEALKCQDEALTVCQKAIGKRRDLVKKNRARYLPDLACNLTNLCQIQNEAGQHEEALRSGGEALEISRELVTGDRKMHLPTLAMNLFNLSKIEREAALQKHGQAADILQAAAEHSRESDVLCLELERIDRDRFAALLEQIRKEKRQAILVTLTRREVPISERIREQILNCRDADKLTLWLDRAFNVPSADKLIEVDPIY